jgi:uncharacterized membrane protein YdjX (TVP38/TMEM64 family)
MRKLLILSFVICAVILAILLFTRAPLGLWIMDTVQWIQGLGVPGGILFALIYVVITVALFPQTPLNLAAGFLYGTLWGSVVVSLASTTAATIAFFLSRYCAREIVARKLGNYARFDNLDQAIGQNGLKLVTLMRLQPVFVPFAYLNMGLGLTRVRLLDYVLGTFLGTLPGTILYAYLGSAVKDLSFFAFHTWPSEGLGPRWFFWIGLVAVATFCLVLAQIARQNFSAVAKKAD